jgi:hypothetical protein
MALSMVFIPSLREAQPRQSVDYQLRRSDAASVASTLLFEDDPNASCSPFIAADPWLDARERVSADYEIQARWFAEKASTACITKAYEDASPKNLFAC